MSGADDVEDSARHARRIPAGQPRRCRHGAHLEAAPAGGTTVQHLLRAGLEPFGKRLAHYKTIYPGVWRLTTYRWATPSSHTAVQTPATASISPICTAPRFLISCTLICTASRVGPVMMRV